MAHPVYGEFSVTRFMCKRITNHTNFVAAAAAVAAVNDDAVMYFTVIGQPYHTMSQTHKLY